MQPTRTQVERSLDALEHSILEYPEEPEQSGQAAAELPPGLVERLSQLGPVRIDRMVEARLRLDAGDGPTADDLADRLVGRLVCDRLR